MRTESESRALISELLSTIEYRVVVQAHDDEDALDDLVMLQDCLNEKIRGHRVRVAQDRQASLLDLLR